MTLIPMSLAMQFKRIANIYFLVISVLMLLGRYVPEAFQTPLDPFSTIVTFVFVLGVTCAKEGAEDYQRGKSDKHENEKPVTIVTFDSTGKAQETSKHCSEIKGGDIIKLTGKVAVPCDMLLCCTSNWDDSNQAYVETANIDGETNLKLKQAPAELHGLWDDNGNPKREMFEGTLKFLEPDNKIYNFEGAYNCKAVEDPIPLGPLNVLLRSSLFSNTDWGYGIAIYTGQETKIQMNNREAEMKMSNVEKLANKAIIAVFCAQVVLCTITVISLYAMGFQNFDVLPYVYPAGTVRTSKLPLWMEYWFIFFLLFNNFIPISLYVTIELVNLGQAAMINADEKIYYEKNDVPTNVKSSNLAQELGMVSNIFSDKTGTLTCNEMELVKFVVDGEIFSVEEAAVDSGNTKAHLPGTSLPNQVKIHDFLRCLSTCHTVLRESDGTYRAESPDELALVRDTEKMGCAVITRGTTEMRCNIFGREEMFEVLACNAFNSDRKRSSLLLKNGSDYYVMCKGADNIMIPLCNTTSGDREWIEQSLLDLACMGLRTLVIAQKKISATDAEKWLSEFHAAAASMTDREGMLAKCGNDLEQNLEFLGITAIEDKLQDQVPEVIADLAKAGIVVWMLTGDKEQTAINIGRSCNLVLEDTKLFMLSGLKRTGDKEHNLKCKQTFHNRMKDIYDDINENWVDGDDVKSSGYYDKAKDTFVSIALVLDGPSFDFFDFDENGDCFHDQVKWFLYIGSKVRSVISCRLTPLQKESVVNLVKTHTVPKATCLAIGDGANDVPMILEGDVGVGIYGQEGRQAANNADFAIGQFKYLKRLLLVHGRWNYIRQANVFLYSLHKNAVITFLLYWFCYFTSVSGSTPFQSYIYSAYNIALGLPIIFYGILDRDLPDDFVERNPQVYETGQKNEILGTENMIGWTLNVLCYAIILSLLFYYAAYDSFTNDAIFIAGTVVFQGLVLSLQTKVIFMHNQWAYPQALCMLISITGMFWFYPLVQTFNYDTFYMAAGYLYTVKSFWFLGSFTAPMITMIFEAIVYYGRLLFYPSREMLFRELYHRVRFLDSEYLPLANTDITDIPVKPMSPTNSKPNSFDDM
jgi:phospholipid-transporting ATPase